MSDVAYNRFAIALQLHDVGNQRAREFVQVGDERVGRADRETGEPFGKDEPRKMKRPTILTSAVLAQVPGWLQKGRTADEIAASVGCTVGTLRVKCSQKGISLRRGALAQRQSPKNHPKLSISLPIPIIAVLEARASGQGVTSRKLVATLIKTIVNDDLFEAVLDGEPA
jgi:hypothetical protein